LTIRRRFLSYGGQANGKNPNEHSAGSFATGERFTVNGYIVVAVALWAIPFLTATYAKGSKHWKIVS